MQPKYCASKFRKKGQVFIRVQIFKLKDFNKIVFVQADQICYAVLCVFSYVAAGQNRKKSTQKSGKPRSSNSVVANGGHLVAGGGISPRGQNQSDIIHKS
jgi:hypothetical protein